MNIREALESDKEILRQFKSTEWPAEDAIHFGDTDMNYENREFTYVAEEDGKISGYVKFSGDMGVCRVGSVLVGKEYRGKGIGKDLMAAVEEVCRKHNYHKIWLETGVDWEAKKFYEALGFIEVVVLRNHFGHKDFSFMEKFLE